MKLLNLGWNRWRARRDLNPDLRIRSLVLSVFASLCIPPHANAPATNLTIELFVAQILSLAFPH